MNTLDTIYNTLSNAAAVTVSPDVVAYDGNKLRIRNQTLSIIDIDGAPNLLVQFDGNDWVNHFLINEDGTLGNKNLKPTDLFDMMGQFIEPNYSTTY